jgi:3-oxoacyl-[acyl-carrier-protein] synthase III
MTKIIGTGSYLPEIRIPNSAFFQHAFFDSGVQIDKSVETIIEKFSAITGIRERRYANDDQLSSDLGFLAGEDAIKDAGIDKETLDYIIVAHNFGDVLPNHNRVNIVPTLSSKIKALLKIQNPNCVAYDLPFGCPGWVEGVIQAHYFLKSGDARRCLVIGTETLSRVIDPHDRDSMIFSDGAGAAVLEVSNTNDGGILSHKTQTYAVQHYDLINMGSCEANHSDNDDLYLKMKGRKVYEFALSHVPLVVKEALDKAQLDIRDIKKILIHQANEKMDHAIAERLLSLYGIKTLDNSLIPMTIDFLGNSSVATVPTMLDLILKGELDGHVINKGDNIVMASVGAGMNINAIVYQA